MKSFAPIDLDLIWLISFVFVNLSPNLLDTVGGLGFQGYSFAIQTFRRRMFFVISNSSLIRACVNDDDEVQSELVF